MRKLLGSVLAVLLVALGFAAPSAAQLAQDSATGSGTTTSFAFDLDARSGPSGENPTGNARVGLIVAPSLEVEGPVTCLTVTGNRAVIGIENSLGFQPLGRGAFIEVTDGGTSDSLQVSAVPQAPTVCPATLNLFQEPVVSGDIIVVDAPALPTSKDQCKNGGWQSFGVFKNQGDCVSFVATKGRNPAAGS